MKLHVKYCGGCNPRFDRPEFVAAVAEQVKADVVYEYNGDDQICLLLSGCERNCLRELERERTITVTQSDQLEAVIKQVREKNNQR